MCRVSDQCCIVYVSLKLNFFSTRWLCTERLPILQASLSFSNSTFIVINAPFKQIWKSRQTVCFVFLSLSDVIMNENLESNFLHSLQAVFYTSVTIQYIFPVQSLNWSSSLEDWFLFLKQHEWTLIRKKASSIFWLELWLV